MLDFGYMAKLAELSVFLPAFNEEKIIAKTVSDVLAEVPQVASKWEVVVVNDGSQDKTGEVVEKLIEKKSNLRLVNHSRNRGYGASLKSGFYGTKYAWIAFIDSDGQFDFSEIKNFVEKQAETKADLVIGYYRRREASFLKVLTSKVWEYLVYLIFNLKVKDIDCAFKLVSRRVIDKIPKLESERGAFISSELLIKAKKAGFKIVEVPVTHYPRVQGEGTGRNLNVIVKSFMDLFKLWWKLR